MTPSAFLLIATFVFAFGLISGRLQRTPISPPMIFVGFGVIVGPHVFNLLDLHVNDELVHIIAELTLILVLFTDASRIDFRALRQGYHLPLRLLAVGLPLTLVVGSIIGMILFWGTFSVWEAALLAAILAPTDAALGQAVVSSPRVPLRIRQALNVESGLNDGIALPAVMILLAIAGAHGEAKSNAAWLQFIVLQLTLGPLTGIVVGFCGGQLLQIGMRTQWMNHTFEQLSGISIALAAFAGAELDRRQWVYCHFCCGIDHRQHHTSRL